jgi:hypothetical protein
MKSKGAGLRCPLPDGVVITKRVPRSRIVAYLTGRELSDPASLLVAILPAERRAGSAEKWD